jgi:uncharacterized protein (TIRG00374 family)
MRKPRRILLSVAGWVLSILLVWGLLRTAPLSAIWSAVRAVQPGFILGAMACAALALVLRGLRWAAFFGAHAHVSRLSISSLAFMGLAINAVLPGRVGDLARATLAARKHQLSFAYTTTTVLLERLVDGLTLLLFLGLSLLSLHTTSLEGSVDILGATVSADTLRTALRSLTVACLALATVTGLVALPRTRNFVLALASRLPRWGPTLAGKLETAFEEIDRGLRSARRPSVLAPLLVYSALTWLALTGCNYLVALGMGGIELPFRGALVVTAVAIAVASIPSAPGAWGVFEAGALLTLAFLGIEPDEATGVAYAFAAHFSQYLPVVLFGVLAALLEHVSWRDLKFLRRRGAPPPLSTDTRRSETGSDGS